MTFLIYITQQTDLRYVNITHILRDDIIQLDI